MHDIINKYNCIRLGQGHRYCAKFETKNKAANFQGVRWSSFLPLPHPLPCPLFLLSPASRSCAPPRGNTGAVTSQLGPEAQLPTLSTQMQHGCEPSGPWFHHFCVNKYALLQESVFRQVIIDGWRVNGWKCRCYLLIVGNTKYRKGLQRTSRKTAKDCRRTAKELQEDHKTTKDCKVTWFAVTHRLTLSWRVGHWCYSQRWHHRLLYSHRNRTLPCCHLCQWLHVAVQLTRLCD